MKRQLFIILLILPQLIFSQEKAGQLWEKANALYSSEKYQEAISAYEQILATGEESAKVYFNLGNAYYKAGDVNNAILSFERAKLLAPNDKDIDFNLSIANQYVVTSIDKLPQPFFLRWRDSVLNKYTVDGWSEISIGAFILFLVLIGLFIFSKTITIRRVSFWLGIFTLIFSGLTFSFAARQKSKITKRNHAIVFCPRVTVKSSPSKSGTDLFLIYEGLKVEITDSLSTWKEIQLADGNEGWLPDSCIVKI